MEPNKELTVDQILDKINNTYGGVFTRAAAKKAMEEYASAWKAKYDELARWQQEATLVLNPILDYGQKHPDIKLGQSISTFVVERCMQYDELKAENEALKVIRDSSQENYDELLREHAALKEKADKMAEALQDIARQHKSNEWESEGDTEHGYNCIIDVARDALSTYSNKEDQP